jgi:hypothetical protein
VKVERDLRRLGVTAHLAGLLRAAGGELKPLDPLAHHRGDAVAHRPGPVVEVGRGLGRRSSRPGLS